MTISIVHLRFADHVTTATIFTNIESYECPVCSGENVELMPLNLDEKYEYNVDPNKGLEIRF